MTEKLDLQRRRLCETVEKVLDQKMRTPKDFDFLREQIYQKLNVLISSTTLKRIWGYLIDESTPRNSTLSVLARFVGYADYESFCNSLSGIDLPSDSILGNCLHTTEDLAVADRVILRWEPQRVCVVEYQGDGQFVVLSSEMTRL